MTAPAVDELDTAIIRGLVARASDPKRERWLQRLHAMGQKLAIDDFATGHSSLVYLQRLPIDQIKIDRSFIEHLASVPGDAVIVRSTIDLAHNPGLSVVAEGVEDEAALDMLVEYGCDNAQGYLFNRPRAADEITEWLTESPSEYPRRRPVDCCRRRADGMRRRW